MHNIYVVGGEQKQDATLKAEWHGYRRGMVLKVDLVNQTATRCAEYETPAELCPDDDPSILFKAGTLANNKLYCCTQTEVLVYSYPEFQLQQHISHPWFNDLHHVALGPDGNIFVVNTGLDMVLQLSPEGTLIQEWSALPDTDLWQRFSRDTDYRKVPTTKPHHAHPNYVFFLDDDIWSTRFVQKDAICLNNPEKRIPIDVASVHDGHVTDDAIYFTTVNGRIVIVDRDSLTVRDVVNLGKISNGSKKPGWCRGLAMLEPGQFLVGYSQLRPTRWTGNLKWFTHGVRELKRLFRQPARISLYDLHQKRLLWEFSLHDYGMSTVFSIHPDPELSLQQLTQLQNALKRTG